MSKDVGYSNSKADGQGSRIRELKADNQKLKQSVELMQSALKHYSADTVDWTIADEALATVNALLEEK